MPHGIDDRSGAARGIYASGGSFDELRQSIEQALNHFNVQSYISVSHTANVLSGGGTIAFTAILAVTIPD